MEEPTQILYPWLLNIIIAIMILLIGFMAGKIIGKILNKLFKEMQLDKALHRFTAFRFSISKIISVTITVVIYIISFFLAFEQLGITSALIWIIVVAALIIIIGALILGLGGFFPNLYAGFKIKSKHLFKVGQNIKVKTAKGKITKIGFFRINIITKDDEKIVIPTSTVLKS